MIPVLITTGKGPDRVSRAIARAFSLAVPESRLEPRGKRTMAALLAKARRLHLTRLCAIYRSQGKPSTISFLKVGDDGSWERLAPVIFVGKASFAAKFPKAAAQSRCLSITGTKAKALSALVSPKNSCEETGSRIIAGAKKLSISVGRKKIMELGVSYGK